MTSLEAATLSLLPLVLALAFLRFFFSTFSHKMSTSRGKKKKKKKKAKENIERKGTGILREGLQEALVGSVVAGDMKRVETLVAQGADVNHGYSYAGGATVLILAALHGHVEVVRLLVEKLGAKVNQANQQGATALMLAAQFGHVDVVRLLVEKLGAKVNQADQKGTTALMLAAVKGNLDVVKLLIRRLGANVNQLTKVGWSALHLASISKRTEVVKYLARHGADVTQPNSRGYSPASLALVPQASTDMPPPNPELAAYLESKASCANPDCPRGGLKKCSRCQRVRYCGAACQKAHWKAGHKRECVPPPSDNGGMGNS